MMKKRLEQIVVKMRDKGERMTLARKKIINIFYNSKQPLSAAEVLRLLQKDSKSDKTTVYRQIEDLLKHGLIEEVRFAGQSRKFEIALGDHHHHLVCLKCSKVVDVDVSDDLKSFEDKISKQKKFKVLRHSLEFLGYCSSCQKKF
jgi:Fe2+ or Zn2+ uptake regulation protein